MILLDPEVEEFGQEMEKKRNGLGLEELVLIGDHLSREQQTKLKQLTGNFLDIFSEIPGEAKGVEHTIVTPKGQIVRGKWRRIPYHWYWPIKEELNKMLA